MNRTKYKTIFEVETPETENKPTGVPESNSANSYAEILLAESAASFLTLIIAKSLTAEPY